MRYWLSWNGTNCREKGIRLQEMPQIVRPEERVTHIEIPGRSGELTITEDDDIYNSYIQTIPLIVDNAADVHEAESWLRGNGYVTFCSQPELKQKARVINAVEFQKHSWNSSWWEAQAQFYCQPLKELITEESIEVTEDTYWVINPGDVASRPLITIEGSGTISLRISEREMILYNAQSGWVIDCENEWVLNNGVPLTGVYTGEFPRFLPGYNLMQFTGNVTKLTINGRWRYL